MEFLEKIDFLENALKINDRKFAKKFEIKPSLLKKWRKGLLKPSTKDIVNICKEYNLDPKDFLNSSSTLAKPNKKEHECKILPREDSSNVIYEDFAREDNSRYEEKD